MSDFRYSNHSRSNNENINTYQIHSITEIHVKHITMNPAFSVWHVCLWLLGKWWANIKTETNYSWTKAATLFCMNRFKKLRSVTEREKYVSSCHTLVGSFQSWHWQNDSFASWFCIWNINVQSLLMFTENSKLSKLSTATIEVLHINKCKFYLQSQM